MKIKKKGKVVNLTESDLQRVVKKTIKESSDKDYEKEMGDIESELREEFVEIMESIAYELENIAEDDIHYAADNDGIMKELKGYFDAIEDLKDFEREYSDKYAGELMEEVEEILDTLTNYFPYNIEVTMEPEIEELLTEYYGNHSKRRTARK